MNLNVEQKNKLLNKQQRGYRKIVSFCIDKLILILYNKYINQKGELIMCLRRIDYIEGYVSRCDEIRKKYPCIDFDTFAEEYYKKFDETETGTYN